MTRSGLKELLEVIHAPNSVDRMMSGHAYGRVLRGHILVHRALGHIIMQTEIYKRRTPGFGKNSV